MHIFRELWRGKDMYRILMNEECTRHEIHGKVIDVGSGLTRASYHRFLRQKRGTSIAPLDLGFSQAVGGQAIDLETDPLPYARESVDTVLLFNVLEHIYNYQHVVKDVQRVLKSGGTVLGAVPFLVCYHADPHDYWRYTHETLQRIFAQAGFTSAQVVPFGRGPCTAGFSQKEIAYHRILKMLVVPSVLFFDWVIVRLRPSMDKKKFPLGYFFVLKK